MKERKKKIYHDIQNRRCNITTPQAEAPSLPHLFPSNSFGKPKYVGISSHNKGNRNSRIRSMGIPSLEVDHLLSVSVVSCDEKDVSGFLTGFVDNSDRFVGVGYRFDCA